MERTSQQYAAALDRCRKLFLRKMSDYGTAWRIMRLPSLTDQLFIKAKRIRSLQQGEAWVNEGIEPEFIALVNYALLALVQEELGDSETIDLESQAALRHYNTAALATQQLMEAKNHDYGEAWRDMRIASLTDLILMKIHRIKQIEDNDGQTLASEGVRGGYADIANYALFALIKLDEART